MNLRNRKGVSLFLSLALVLGVLIGTVPTMSFAEEEAKTLTILHVNDIHGRFEYDDDRNPSIGHARFKTFVEDLREEGNVLLLDAGDVLHGTTDINLSEGKAMAEKLTLKIELDAGIVDGKQKVNYKSFSKIKTDAADEDLHGTATTLADLQERDLVAIKKVETSELAQE